MGRIGRLGKGWLDKDRGKALVNNVEFESGCRNLQRVVVVFAQFDTP